MGEIAILKDDLPQGRWKMGKIQSLIETDIDKFHRAAGIKPVPGRIVKRPFKQIEGIITD